MCMKIYLGWLLVAVDTNDIAGDSLWYRQSGLILGSVVILRQ